MLEEAVDDVEDWVDDRVEDVAKAYKQADKWVDDRVDDMEYWVADAKKDTTKAINNTKSWIEDKVDDAEEAVVKTYNNAKTNAIKNYNNIKEAVSDTYNKVEDWAEDKIDDAKERTKKAVDDSVDWLEEKAEDVGEWGKDKADKLLDLALESPGLLKSAQYVESSIPIVRKVNSAIDFAEPIVKGARYIFAKDYREEYLNREEKLNSLTEGGIKINNQHDLGNIPYGALGTASGNSCGFVGAYNVCVDLGIDVDIKEVYDYFSENGTMLGGVAGTNPITVVDFLNERPEVKDVTIYTDEKNMGEHDSYILLYGGVFSEPSPIIKEKGFEVHYQQFNKDEKGNIILSNTDEIIKPNSLGINNIDSYLNNRLNVLDGYMIIGIDKDETYGLPGMMNTSGINPNIGM